MAGVNQVQINERVGLTFASGLRTILDRTVPEVAAAMLVDGYEVLTASEVGEPAMLVATGPEDQQARDRALAAGAAGSVTKPFAEAELRAEVAAALGRRAALTTSH